MPVESKHIDVNIEDEMKTSYIDYAMSVIIGRALPDARDGLKPVHRRALFAMHEARNSWNSPYKKSARIVGDVMGKYHPHGDQAIYDTIVRMAQQFSLRYLLVDGQGNFGSVDGDPPAAMRYTEVRMARMAHELLADIEKDTVDFGPNYDDSLEEPLVLPTRVPNLLINGSEGIAVGMATKIPPHNLREILAATRHLLENPDCLVDDLMELVSGPDFPTAGQILGVNGIHSAYRTGRGVVRMRALAAVEEMAGGRESIIVTELPFQVNKARLVEKIADLVRHKKLEGISDLRDESDRTGMRVVIELKRDAVTDVVLNNLFKMTPMMTSFGINILAIVNRRPVLLDLKEALAQFIDHRRVVVTRRTKHELRKAEERAHILEGLLIALEHLDEVIALIRKAPDPPTASDQLCERFELSEVQAKAILEMRLQKLTGLEQDKIRQEHAELMEEIGRLKAILEDETLLRAVIREELAEIEERYGDERRTEILPFEGDIDDEDLIPEEQMVVTVSHQGYIKRVPLVEYRAQRRGGRGKAGMSTKDEDWVDDLFVASTHSHVIIFTDKGRCFRLKVYQLPPGSRTARGKAVVNLIKLDDDERMTQLLPVYEWPEEAGQQFIFFTTRLGRVKKTDLAAYRNIRSNGLYAIQLEDEDKLIGCRLVTPSQHVLLVSASGMAIRFDSDQARPMGRRTRGVRGMKLRPGDRVVDMMPCQEGTSVLTTTENGYGKRTPIEQYRPQNRAGLGLIDIKTSARNGQVIGAKLVGEGDQIMMVTDGGTIVRTSADEVRDIGRNTQGVTLVRVQEGERVVALARVVDDDDEGIEGEEGAEGEPTAAASEVPPDELN